MTNVINKLIDVDEIICKKLFHDIFVVVIKMFTKFVVENQLLSTNMKNKLINKNRKFVNNKRSSFYIFVKMIKMFIKIVIENQLLRTTILKKKLINKNRKFIDDKRDS